MREATPRDVEAVMELERACFDPDKAFSREMYDHALGEARAVNLLEEDGSALVGFVGAFHHARWRAGHIYTLNVHPKGRRRGIGRALLAECEARLAALGMRAVALEVRTTNAPAIGLYEKAGYQRDALIEAYYEDGGDAWRYVKALPTPTARR